MKKALLLLIASFLVHYIFVTDNCEGQWIQVSNEMGTNTMAFRLVSDGTKIFVGTIGTGIWRSTNNGQNWTAINNGIPIQQILYLRGLTISGNNIFAGFYFGGGIYRSTNDGNSWSICGGFNWDSVDIMCLASSGSNIFAGTSGYPPYVVLRSTDYGNSWSSVSNGLPNATINSIIISGTNIFVGTYMNGVYRSNNNGGSWIFAGNGLPNQIVNCLASSGSNIFAGTDTAGTGGVYISTNYGGSWTQTSLNNTNVYGLLADGTNLFAGTGANLTAENLNIATGGVFLTTNNGTTWLDKSQGLNTNNLLVAPLLIVNNYIFAGTSQSVWRRSYQEIIGIQNMSAEIPSAFSLHQSYPNPFNPSTNIRFDIPKTSDVKLIIYDILGKEITTLVNEQLHPGAYEVEWDGSNYTSGVYFYKLETMPNGRQAEGFSETKRMVLVK